MTPQLYDTVRILNDDPRQCIHAGDQGVLVEWLDPPAPAERIAIIELFDGRDDPIVEVPASGIEAMQQADALKNDVSERENKRAG
jgi:hypothetical protein